MSRDRTAVIVNDRGEAFVGWRSHCEISVSGYETYHSRPLFVKETVLHHSPLGLWRAGVPADRPLRVNRPYVFSSERAARRAASRMGDFPRSLAVVA